ncbi:MAG: hypothetical protein PHX83_10220 [Acidobacteriia bacterium]|nr:hypothetical protein [Terriglobia bacterium]
MALEKLRLTDFNEQRRTKFQVVLSEASKVELQLIQVTDHTRVPEWEQFSLIFQGPPEPFLEQKIYSMGHSVLGSFDVFLVPVGKQPAGFLYEAVFNRRAQ